MKTQLIALLFVGLALAGCQKPPPATANDAQRDQQAAINLEGAQQVGMPDIVNYRDMRGVRYWYEQRDKANLLTYTYTKNMQGQWIYFCDSIGYPIPGGTQYSAGESMQRYRVRDPRYGADSEHGWTWGVTRLPQAEPNGVFPPSTAEGTGIICISPINNKAEAVYAEEKVSAFPWPQKGAVNEPDRSAPAKTAPADPLAKK